MLTSVDITLRGTGRDGTTTEEDSEDTNRPIECRVILFSLDERVNRYGFVGNE